MLTSPHHAPCVDVPVSRAGAEPDLAALELQPPLPGLTLTWLTPTLALAPGLRLTLSLTLTLTPALYNPH